MFKSHVCPFPQVEKIEKNMYPIYPQGQIAFSSFFPTQNDPATLRPRWPLQNVSGLRPQSAPALLRNDEPGLIAKKTHKVSMDTTGDPR